MGGRRLPVAETVRTAALLGLAAAFGVLAAACFFGGDDKDDESTPTPGASETTTATASPTPSPTPNFLATPPASQLDALSWLKKALGPNFDPPCPDKLKQAGVACAAGDADGDGAEEFAYLVPVNIETTQRPYPASVFIRDGATGDIKELAIDLTADASILGISFFAFEDRTGDGEDDLSYLQNLCGTTGCRTVAVIQVWDGTAWRDAGPSDAGISNIDSVEWEGAGADSRLVIHGGRLPANAPVEAGPTRASTTTYTFQTGRYLPEEIDPDPPEYLYHAFLDAERAFKSDRPGSAAAFEAIIANTELKDWKSRPADPDRRPSLKGFALFRLALIEAASNGDPAALTTALDRVINQSTEPLFLNVTDEFRRGYNEQGGLIGGCGAVNLYLSRPVPGADTPGYVENLFDYGYANPSGRSWLTEICPF